MRIRLLLPTLMALSAVATALGNTAGSVEFTATTKSAKGKYAPRHVLAVWVTNSKGQFVKTLELYGRKRMKYLKRWAEQSRNNQVDAVTGATAKTHRAHTVTWDCRDTKGALVPDGEYQIHVELTENDRQGPVTPPGHIKFAKGPREISSTPKDLPFLTTIKLKYVPSEAVPTSATPKEE
jgi:hypothetical protein